MEKKSKKKKKRENKLLTRTQNLSLLFFMTIGRSIETMNGETTWIELAHKKWHHNIHSAALNANTPQFDLLNREYEKWCHLKQTQIRDINLFELDLDHITPTSTETIEKSKETGKTKKEVNTNMELGERLGNHMTSLSPYWHEIMVNKNIHVPVSIFCPKWILQDLNYTRRKAKTNTCHSESNTYNGSPVLNEYRLTFGEWLVRFNLMIKYHELKYDVLDSQKNSPIAP
jgi:hypothetical protein